MRPIAAVACVLAGILALAGCKQEDQSAKTPSTVRPVLTILVKSEAEQQFGFAGTIQPRYQTDRGFQVLGRIISRDVAVGDVVKAGQTLATLDPLVFDLAVRSSEADLAKARSELTTAAAAEARRGTLFEKQVVSEADLEAAQQARAAAAASKQQSEANLDKAREQRSYTRLTADIDGVVTSTDAEVGQTVSPGKKVMTLARMDIREAVIDPPENVVRSITADESFEIRLQADASIRVTGKVREIAPQADTATRTRRVRITLDRIIEPFRLGTTITATPIAPVTEAGFEVPRSALLNRDGVIKVWRVDPGSRTVKAVAVQISPSEGPTARVTSGVAHGDRIVVAGVNSLAEGQPVKLEGGKLQ